MFFSKLQRTHNIQSGPEKIAQSSMHHHSATVCSRITVFTKMPRKDHSLPVSAKFLSVG